MESRLRKEFEKLLLDISQRKEIDGGDLTVAGTKIVSACRHGLDIGRASVWKVTKEGITCQILMHKTEIEIENGVELLRSDFPSYFSAIDTERALIAHDAENDPATCEFRDVYLRPLSIKSMLDIPIRYRGKMYGIICCEHVGLTTRHWQDDEVLFVSTLAELYGRAISANYRCEYENVLKAVNANLEEVIAERTLELEKSLEELKETQSQLVESEKMAALGHLVSGVAHEVNTPLGVAVTSISAMKERLDAVFDALAKQTLTQSLLQSTLENNREAIDLALSNLGVAANLINDFKKIAVDQTHIELTEIELKDYLQHVLNTLSADANAKKVALNYEASNEVILKTYPGNVAQVISNIVKNCFHHAFEEETKGDGYQASVNVALSTHVQASGIKQCVIEVSDNGSGMTPEELEKIFEPFYTTARGKGRKGLGLAVAYNTVVGQLKGNLNVSSDKGKGTRFRVYLPMEAD